MLYNIEDNNVFALTYSNMNNLRYKSISINKNTPTEKKALLTHHTLDNIIIEKHNISKAEIFLNIHDNSYIWMLYIILYGYDEYQILERKDYFVKEQELRYKLVELLGSLSSKDKNRIKTEKVCIKDIISEIGNNCPLSFDSFTQLNKIFKHNICLSKKYISFLIHYSDDDIFWICDIKKQRLYKLNKEHNKDYIENKYYLVENINKPFKSESYYKVDELRKICEQFNITIKREDGKNKTKKELYKELMYKIEL